MKSTKDNTFIPITYSEYSCKCLYQLKPLPCNELSFPVHISEIVVTNT